MSLRRRRCQWCKYLSIDMAYCTREPKWLDIPNSESHYCGEHEWNECAKDEIRKEIQESMAKESWL